MSIFDLCLFLLEFVRTLAGKTKLQALPSSSFMVFQTSNHIIKTLLEIQQNLDNLIMFRCVILPLTSVKCGLWNFRLSDRICLFIDLF